MPTFVCSLGWTEQGIKTVKDVPKRAKAARKLAEKLSIDIKQVYMTNGEDDLLVILEAANGDNVAKFALALSSQGNVRTRTVRAWSEEEMTKLISELP
ncbi:MAG: GYD domain-containing protein [Rhizobiales bacterium]|nr:GYD domain-containing protein [Hyphomicrobiales bacterium]